MREGVAAAQEVFAAFLEEMEWAADDIHKTFCHQVGRAHQRLLFESLGLEPRIDYSTFEHLGNTGSVALPMTAAIGIENGHLHKDDHVALLGIGSGINVIMLGVEWQRSLVEKCGPRDFQEVQVAEKRPPLQWGGMRGSSRTWPRHSERSEESPWFSRSFASLRMTFASLRMASGDPISHTSIDRDENGGIISVICEIPK